MTSGGEFLGVAGPFPVDSPWWSEVEPVIARLSELLGIATLVLRLVDVDGGGGGRDGHVTYHVEALERPVPGLLKRQSVDQGLLHDHQVLRSPWARADGLRELLDWAAGTLASAGRPVTGPVEQRRTWNLAGLFRLPTARGTVWLKTTPHFAADEATVAGAFAGVDPDLVAAVLGSGEHRILMEHIPGEDCWRASPETIASVMERFVAAQSALASSTPAAADENRIRDWRAPVLTARIHELLAGPVALELSAQELANARELTRRWNLLAECGLPDTLVHGDFHPGNWRGDGGSPVVVDFADAHWGNPVLDGLRVQDFLPESHRARAARAWIDAWQARLPAADPARALAIAEPLAHLTYAVRYQEFLDGIEPSEWPYHRGDPADEIRAAVRCAEKPSPHLAGRSSCARGAISRAATR
ncbi:aminoglycoside phosphotransferase family protein [Streptomyces dengpaensis]|uniref:Aminoglycoside phosphotransferase family protein n=1 Tax=Streptomyces dengpaensis TaxID=2049881 RepID=A0ABN5IBF1_9ACTN|nr:aminoglycoside phosphotransferase family protein [Streptomyces dengpaensis]PIB07583.1 aminoglycoside phosphotransferase [Streptomyces sp. HG99]